MPVLCSGRKRKVPGASHAKYYEEVGTFTVYDPDPGILKG